MARAHLLEPGAAAASESNSCRRRLWLLLGNMPTLSHLGYTNPIRKLGSRGFRSVLPKSCAGDSLGWEPPRHSGPSRTNPIRGGPPYFYPCWDVAPSCRAAATFRPAAVGCIHRPAAPLIPANMNSIDTTHDANWLGPRKWFTIRNHAAGAGAVSHQPAYIGRTPTSQRPLAHGRHRRRLVARAPTDRGSLAALGVCTPLRGRVGAPSTHPPADVYAPASSRCTSSLPRRTPCRRRRGR